MLNSLILCCHHVLRYSSAVLIQQEACKVILSFCAIMALRKSTANGLRLLLRNQELYGGSAWFVLARDIHEVSSRQPLPVSCALLHPHSLERPRQEDEWREWCSSREYHGSMHLWQSAQPAVAPLTEDEESRRDAGRETPATSGQPSTPSERAALYRDIVLLLSTWQEQHLMTLILFTCQSTCGGLQHRPRAGGVVSHDVGKVG